MSISGTDPAVIDIASKQWQKNSDHDLSLGFQLQLST
jgi:hypothetical protein